MSLESKTCGKGHSYSASKRNCPTCQKVRYDKWRAAHKDAVAQHSKKWKDANKDQVLAYSKEYHHKNKSKVSARHKEWKRANKAHVAEYNQNYISTRRKGDALFSLAHKLRSRTLLAFKSRGIKKSTKALTLLGCDWSDLQAHLILSAINRYGFWLGNEAYHIDHITPLASARTEEELIALCHYTNLQLLTPPDNLRKGAKLQQ